MRKALQMSIVTEVPVSLKATKSGMAPLRPFV